MHAALAKHALGLCDIFDDEAHVPLAREVELARGAWLRADVELIHIADTESDAELKREAFERLRLLATPKANDYLQKVSEKR